MPAPRATPVLLDTKLSYNLYQYVMISPKLTT